MREKTSGTVASADLGEDVTYLCALYLCSLVSLIIGRVAILAAAGTAAERGVTIGNNVLGVIAMVLLAVASERSRRFVVSHGQKGVLVRLVFTFSLINLGYYFIQVFFGSDFVGSQILTLLSVFYSLPVCYGLVDICVFRIAKKRRHVALAWICCFSAGIYSVIRFLYVFVFSFLEEFGIVVFTAMRDLMGQYAWLSLAEYSLNAVLFAMILITLRSGRVRGTGHGERSES